MLEEGFVPIGESNEWRSCYFHPTLLTLLIVYVDDMIIAGPKTEVAKAWHQLRTENPEGYAKAIVMDDPTPASQFLGCDYDLSETVGAKGNRDKTMTQNMESFLLQCLEAYEQCVSDCGGGQGRVQRCINPLH